MMNQELINAIVEEVINQLLSTGRVVLPEHSGTCSDIVSPECKAIPLVDDPADPEALERMMKRTTARIGVGKVGPRLKTQTLLVELLLHGAQHNVDLALNGLGVNGHILAVFGEVVFHYDSASFTVLSTEATTDTSN